MHVLNTTTDSLSIFLKEYNLQGDTTEINVPVGDYKVFAPVFTVRSKHKLFTLFVSLLQAAASMQTKRFQVTEVSPIALASLKNHVDSWGTPACTWFVSSDLREAMTTGEIAEMFTDTSGRVMRSHVVFDDPENPVLPTQTMYLLPKPEVLGVYAFDGVRAAIGMQSQIMAALTVSA